MLHCLAFLLDRLLLQGMVEEFGKLEEAATDLKVFLGDEVGEEVSNSFRKIAKRNKSDDRRLDQKR